MADSRFSPKTQLFFKRNFSDVIESLVPRYYIVADKALINDKIDAFDATINTHISIAENISQILDLPQGIVFSSLATFDGIFPFFDKKNSFSDIDKLKFEKEILFNLQTSFNSFTSKANFKSYVETTLIPTLNNSRGTPDSVDYYLNRLGWFYLLATDSTESVQPSSIVVDYFVDKLYEGYPLTIADGINALSEFIWKNDLPYIPTDFIAGTGEYVSGTQQLDKLKTVNEILYSNTYLDKLDTYISDSFSLYRQTNEYTTNLVNNGPFWRLLKAFSFSFADMQNEANSLQTLYDLQDCPDEYLPEIAQLIGWKLAGYDRNKWRLQLANAVSLYRKVGTRSSIQAALNNLFSEDSINMESYLRELWESYIPFLILYSLATESIFFKNYSTFTRDIANSLGIDNYDSSNFENNIRAGVDKILLRLFESFPDHFKLASVPFPIDSEEFVFRYRGKVYPIPPFEEIPYYITSEVTRPFLVELEDLLVCFGVSEEFAAKVVKYISDKTIDDHSDLALDNSWLIFTSSLELPPNWDDVTTISEKDKSLYLSLWNGKSSHYQMNFSAGDFDFSKVAYTPTSKYAILQASRLALEFSPAHAIGIINAIISDSDTYDVDGLLFTEVGRDINEFIGGVSGTPTRFSLGNIETKAINVLEGFDELSGLSRQNFRSLYTPKGFTVDDQEGTIYSTKQPTFNSEDITLVSRNSLRRRNYKNALNLFGYYDRTGFNPPIFRLGKIPGLTQEQDSKLITRGLIPSSLDFVSTDTTCSSLLSSIPNIYQYCSPSHGDPFYGYYLSSTLKTRGSLDYQSDLQGSSMYEDRGQLSPFVYLMYKIEARKLEAEALRDALQNPSYYNENAYWYNFSGSEANKKISCGTTTLSSIHGYYNYSFGPKISKLYQEYLTTFNNHPVTPQRYNENTKHILNHCFGSILENSNFELRNSIGFLSGIYTTKLSDQNDLNLTSQIFRDLATYQTTQVTSSPLLIAKSENLNTTIELVNSQIIKDVDIIHTSGTSPQNNFVLYDLTNFSEDYYASNNMIIKMRSVNGLPRLRFTVSGLNLNQPEEAEEFRNFNFLTPNHKFKLTVKGLGLKDSGELTSDVELGVWIHTKAVGGASYHYNSNGQWERLFNNQITIPYILENLCHKKTFQVKDLPDYYKCVSISDDPESRIVKFTDVNAIFENDYFSEVDIEFNTYFGCDTNQTSSLHNLGQQYIIELFVIPKRQNSDKSIYLDQVSLRDETLWDYTKIDLTGEPIAPLNHRLCDPIQLELEEDEVNTILRTFAFFSGKTRGASFLGRDAGKSSIYHLENGGSRNSQRAAIPFFSHNRNNKDQLTSIIFDNPSAEAIISGFGNGGEDGFYDNATTVSEAIATAPPEGEPPLIEDLNFGLWFG